VGDGLDEEEQLKAQKGTLFIPFSPAMVTPRHLENLHSCEVSKESTRKFKIINILLIYLY